MAFAVGVLARTVVLDGGGDEAVIGAGGVEDLAEVGPAEEVLGGAVVDGLFGLLDLHGVVEGAHQELLEDVVVHDGRLLIHQGRPILVYFDILFIHLWLIIFAHLSHAHPTQT